MIMISWDYIPFDVIYTKDWKWSRSLRVHPFFSQATVMNIQSLPAHVFVPPARCRTLGISTAADSWQQILGAVDGTAIYHHSTRFSYLIDWAPIYILSEAIASIIINYYKAWHFIGLIVSIHSSSKT
jgi:hypothetical protein